MLKPFTFSLSLALALGAYSVSMAGIFDKCATCGIASPQSVVSPQAPIASAQSASCDTCAPVATCDTCVAKKKFCLKDLLPKPKPKVYTYTWVLKKKRVWNWGHGSADCDTCGEVAPTVYPSGQASPQTYAAPQAIHAAPQAKMTPAAQSALLPVGEMKPAMAAIDSVPPAPELPRGNFLTLSPAGN